MAQAGGYAYVRTGKGGPATWEEVPARCLSPPPPPESTVPATGLMYGS